MIGYEKFSDSPAFAHGGSGIVISNGAMKTMLQNIDQCIIKYKTCWAGDVRTALCLKDSGILLSGFSQRFHGGTPYAEPLDDPCATSFVFHHLLVKQMQELWDVESKIRSLNVTNADIFHALIGKKEGEQLQNNIDMPGHDFKTLTTPDAISCQVSCRNEPKCISFSYRNGKCWLKDARRTGKNVTGVVSGFFSDKFICNA